MRREGDLRRVNPECALAAIKRAEEKRLPLWMCYLYVHAALTGEPKAKCSQEDFRAWMINPRFDTPKPEEKAVRTTRAKAAKRAKKLKTGRRHHKGLEWLRVRVSVLQRDGHNCHFCHCHQWLQVHHMQARSDGGTDEMENLLTVCEPCHTRLHEGQGVHKIMKKRLVTLKRIS